MSEQTLWLIIVGLIGIIIGGAGGAAIFRKLFKFPEVSEASESIGKISALAATVAEATAQAFRVELREHLQELDSQLGSNNQRLLDLKAAVDKMLGACPEKHKAVDQRLLSLETRRNRGM